MRRIVGFVLVAAVSAGLAWWCVEPRPRWLPQTITYTIHGDTVDILIETPRWPDETVTAWIARNTAAWAAWEAEHAERHDEDPQLMDDRRGASAADR